MSIARRPILRPSIRLSQWLRVSHLYAAWWSAKLLKFPRGPGEFALVGDKIGSREGNTFPLRPINLPRLKMVNVPYRTMR